MSLFRVLAVSFSVALLAGCGADGESTGTAAELPQSDETATGMIPYPGGQQQKSLREPEAGAAISAAGDLTPAETAAVERARQALADKLALGAHGADAQLVSVAAQQWNNGSLGCAAPGEMSTQVMVDGHKVVLIHENLRYQVHVGPGSARVCERLAGIIAAPNRSFNLSAIPRLQQQAIADLASRFKVAESDIRAERVNIAHWPDASLGCPEEGVDYAQIQVNGYQLPLRVNGTLVIYNTDGRRVVNCLDALPTKPPPAYK